MIKNKIIFVTFCFLVILFSCQREEYFTDPDAKLRFSADTVLFDTVFTGIGSATMRFKVYNPYKQTIRISSIQVARGTASKYKLNIDGQPGYFAENVEIAPKDSLFIFVSVNINPGTDPLIVKDSVLFKINNSTQNVKLIAFGQDVNLIRGKIIQSQTWDDTKPYLIYYGVMVDTLQTLTIKQGVNVFFHRNSWLLVKGNIQVQGTLEEPVVFTGDRLESDYRNVPGQWGGIWILKGSTSCNFNYAEIKNAMFGLRIDSTINKPSSVVNLWNTKIEHHTIAGIYAESANLTANNCLIADCGWYNIALVFGGTAQFIHCTVTTNNWRWSIRNTPVLALNNYKSINNKPVFWSALNVSFFNSIIYGDKQTEIIADAVNPETVSLLFKNCLVKINTEGKPLSETIFPGCIQNQLPKFKDSQKFNYLLDTLSPAKDKADLEVLNIFKPLFDKDLNGKNRISDGKPDIGVYERIE